MSEQIDTDNTPTRTRRNKIGAMRASPSQTETGAPVKRGRGRPPKNAAPVAAATPSKRDNAAPVAAAAQPKRSLAHARLIERIDALVQEHDVKRIGKLLDAVQGLR